MNTGSVESPVHLLLFVANCKLVPEENVRKIRQELKIRAEIVEAAEKGTRALEDAKARVEGELERLNATTYLFSNNTYFIAQLTRSIGDCKWRR